VTRLDDKIAEARPWRDVDFGRLNPLGRFLAQQLLIGVQACLAFRLPRPRRHADPFQLALERPLPPGFRFFLELQPLLLLLQPRRVIPFPGNPSAAIQFENPSGDVVEEVPIVCHGDDRAGVVLQEPLEPCHRFGVEVVGWFVEQQQIRRLQEQPAQRHAAALATRQGCDLGIGRRQPERVHREFEARVEVPRVGGFDFVLNLRLLLQHFLHVGRRQVFAQPGIDVVVTRQQRLDRCHPFLDVPQDGLARVQPRLLMQKPDADAVGRKRFARK
jgi:hypothetical protein